MSADRRPPAATNAAPQGAPVRFALNGRPLEAREGQSLAAALLAAGVTTLTRSPKYRRPRGIHCARGHCPNCLLRVDGVPHVRSCIVPVRDGMRVETEGATAARVDPLRAIDKAGALFPVGFQYRWFKRQNLAWRLWEGQLRRTAAETEMPAPTEVPPAERIAADLLVVGAGPAGIAAAAAAAEAGLRVVLAGRRAALGGGQRTMLEHGEGPADLQAALARVRDDARVRILAPGTVVAAFDKRYLVDAGTHVIEVTAVLSVLATGAYERAIPFPGNDRPGVMLTSALRRLALEDRVLAGRRAALVATDDSAYAHAAELLAAGMEVVAIADVRTDGGLPASAADLHAAGVELIGGARVSGIGGRGALRGLLLAAAAGERLVRCDVVGMSGGWQAADELRYVATSDGQAVVVGERARPLHPDAPADEPMAVLQGVGAVVGTRDVAAAVEEGARAGALAAANVARPADG
jgi:sarcosine oxidase, subunit alpha